MDRQGCAGWIRDLLRYLHPPPIPPALMDMLQAPPRRLSCMSVAPIATTHAEGASYGFTSGLSVGAVGIEPTTSAL